MRTFLVVLVASALLVLPASAAAAVRVQGVTVVDPALAGGERLQVKATARNTGRKRAGANVVIYLVDGKTRRRLGSKKLRGIKPGKTVRFSFRARVPAAAADNAWRVEACAPKCRAAPGALGVRPKPKPAHVSITTTDDYANSDLITRAEGGTASTVSPDGTVFILDVPPEAVAEDTYVTLTPLASATGTPVAGGFKAGVKMEPEGLFFAKPATLSFAREGFAPSPNFVGVGFEAGGRDSFLAIPTDPPPALSGQPAVSFLVFHFSGAFVSAASSSALQAQAAASPSSYDSVVSQELANAEGKAEQTRILENARDLVVEPLLRQALTNEQVVFEAADAFFNWSSKVLIPFGDYDRLGPEHDRLLEILDRALANAYEKFKKECYASKFDAIGQMLRAMGIRKLFGSDRRLPNDLEDLENCLRFELRFETRLEAHEGPFADGARYDAKFHWKTTVPIIYRLGEGFKGSAPWEPIDWSVSGQGTLGPFFNCSYTYQGVSWTGGTYRVLGMKLYAEGKEGYDPTDLIVRVDPGVDIVKTTGEVKCPDQTFPSDNEEPGWIREWGTFLHPGKRHKQASGESYGEWAIMDFKPRAGAYAELHHMRTEGARNVDETYTVVHTPKKD